MGSQALQTSLPPQCNVLLGTHLTPAALTVSAAVRSAALFSVSSWAEPHTSISQRSCKRASHLSICLSVHLSQGSSTLCTGGRSVRRRLQPKADEGRVRDRAGWQSQPSHTANKTTFHCIKQCRKNPVNT